MMYRLGDVLAGTRGELRGSLESATLFPRLIRDSREVGPGDLYIAIKGERLDGHGFIDDAAKQGALAAIVSEEWADAHPDYPLTLIVVDSPNAALQRWAAWRRQRMNVRVVGITGSIGKTSAKESIAAVLDQQFRVYKSPGNFNNEIGLPLAILAAPPDTEVMVLEMGGAYAFGELALLADIAQPDVGVVTNVYPVHLERMGSIEAIAETKSELVRALPPNGTAVLNGDEARVRAMTPLTVAPIVSYGLEEGNRIRATEVETQGFRGTAFWLTIDGQRNAVKVPFVGSHGVYIALVAIAVGHAFGMHIAEMLVGLQDRSIQVRLLLTRGPDGSQLIDDTYNASLPSMLSALGLLTDVEAQRKIAVLGDMRELGDLEREEHQIAGARAGSIADVLVTFGELALLYVDAAHGAERNNQPPLEVHSFRSDQREELTAYLQDELRAGDVALLKGSRGLEMERIIRALRQDSDKPNAGGAAIEGEA